jgi:hypothetical protein
MRMALCYCRQGRGAEAVPEFQRAIGDMEGLVEAFPWNEYYWGNLTWFHEGMAAGLPDERADDAYAMLRNYRIWLDQLTPTLPDEAGPREKLRDAQSKLVDILRNAGLTSDADELAGSLGELSN